jgi:DNA-binding NarL/FixJ family response regulator
VRKGLRDIVEAEPDLAVLGEASDGEAALALIQATHPRIAVLDIHMPKCDGFAVLRQVRRLNLPVDILFLTFHSDPELLHAALDLGGKGYLLKESALVDIVQALRSVAAGRPFVSPALTGALLDRRTKAQSLATETPGLAKLTPSERRVLGRIADGKATKEIAEELCVHSRTVESHRANICQKLGLSGTNSLLRFVLEHKSELHY